MPETGRQISTGLFQVTKVKTRLRQDLKLAGHSRGPVCYEIRTPTSNRGVVPKAIQSLTWCISHPGRGNPRLTADRNAAQIANSVDIMIVEKEVRTGVSLRQNLPNVDDGEGVITIYSSSTP
ncbi:MAG: hypothetical protein DWI22_10275 [Planctomycetota bacterium]|nr:MAG: hypothetical protein DWI22_10275 [Planctomycetota bacterium]